MGRKSRRKKERKEITKRDITLSEVEVEGSYYRMQEIHPAGSKPLTSDEFDEAALVAQVGHEKVMQFAGALTHDLPKKRILLLVTQDYIQGVSPINVALYPPPTDEEMRVVKGVIKEFQ